MQHDASVIGAVAKYFFFISLDAHTTFSSSAKVIAQLDSHNWMGVGHRVEWVRALHRAKSRMRNSAAPAWTGGALPQSVTIPSELDLSAWATFLNSAHAEEAEAVLLSQILGFSEAEIAQGLDVSEGTVRYRVGRGLRHLGGCLES